MLKFDVDGAAKGKPGPTGIGGVLRNSDGCVLALFSKNVSCMESNEAQKVAILKALRIFTSSYQSKMVVESDFLNAIARVSSRATHPWRF